MIHKPVQITGEEPRFIEYAPQPGEDFVPFKIQIPEVLEDYRDEIHVRQAATQIVRSCCSVTTCRAEMDLLTSGMRLLMPVTPDIIESAEIFCDNRKCPLVAPVPVETPKVVQITASRKKTAGKA